MSTAATRDRAVGVTPSTACGRAAWCSVARAQPSVEVHVRHPRLGWIELGGAGLFRPEVRLPLNVEVPVIAWGLGLDRMAMVALEIHDIRDLFSADLEMIRSKRVQY